MSEKAGKDFGVEQLPAFLEHIAREEEEELDKLRREYEAAARKARAEARRASRQYHRRVSDETRNRLESERARELSRSRHELRRRRWEVLRDLRGRARDKVLRRLRERWRHSERQMSWCRYWLDRCDGSGSSGGLDIRLGGEVHESTIEGIRQWAADGGVAAEVSVGDGPREEGIVIHYGARTIDGRLETQLERLLEPIHGELAGWLHSEDNDGPGEEA